jgi:hypothetical protein
VTILTTNVSAVEQAHSTRMFDYVDMLQGPSMGAVDSDDEGADAKPKAAPGKPAEGAAGNFSFWGMATALAENVKKSTADIAARFVCIMTQHLRHKQIERSPFVSRCLSSHCFCRTISIPGFI